MATRIAIVTGASRGIGRSVAVHLAQAGTHVIGTYRQGEPDAQETRRLVEAAGGVATMIPLDVSAGFDFSDFARRIEEVLKRDHDRPTFDILVNNAGFGTGAPLLKTSPEQFDQMVHVHLRGPLFLVQALAHLIADGGHILNLSTGLTRYVMPGLGMYAAAKGATEVLTTYLAQELGPRGIRVNVIAPGAVATDFGGGLVRDDPERAKFVAGMVALGRVAKPDDIGKAAAALLGEGMGWVTGTRLDVSGGQRL